ncbi:MAG: hypothetical protein LBJ32_01130, partial [Oscillospiraceae bacterium]|nr:hypothetical protein [Oscillospiraceae bacterium]
YRLLLEEFEKTFKAISKKLALGHIEKSDKNKLCNHFYDTQSKVYKIKSNTRFNEITNVFF